MAMRVLFCTSAFCSAHSSGKPYVHPSATRCAVLASMITVVSSVTIATASTAASSGKHRIAASASFKNAALFSAFLRSSPVSEMISMSSRFARRSRTCNPVVPASPSMKTFFLPAATITAERRAEARAVRASDRETHARPRRAGRGLRDREAACMAVVDRRAEACGRSGRGDRIKRSLGNFYSKKVLSTC